MEHTIGIDISKDTLDCFQLSSSKHCQYNNDSQEQKALIKWIKSQDTALVVFEATGAYHRCLEAALAKHKHPFAKVNPRQARRFAEAAGRLAKTDRVDAAMLAKMGAVLGLAAQEPRAIRKIRLQPSSARQNIAQLIIAKSAPWDKPVAVTISPSLLMLICGINSIYKKPTHVKIAISDRMSPSANETDRTNVPH